MQAKDILARIDRQYCLDFLSRMVQQRSYTQTDGEKALADMAQRRSGGVIYVRTGLSQEFLCHSAMMEINGLAGGQVSQRAPEHMYRCGREVEENQNGT